MSQLYTAVDNGRWITRHLERIRAQEAAQRGIVVAGIIEQEAHAYIRALAGVVEFGTAHAAGADCAPRVEGLRRHECAGCAAAGRTHRTQVITVDVRERTGVAGGRGSHSGTGSHAIVRDDRAIGAVFDQPDADIACRDTRTAAGTGFFDGALLPS